MAVARCSCGFTELDDEQLTDHLHQVFETEDMKADDGRVHLEGESRACLCGFSAQTAKELDAHLLKAVTPADAIGRDGSRHEAIGAQGPLPAAPQQPLAAPGDA